MDLYAEIKSFSFYENKGSFYIKAKIIEKRITQLCHPKFEEVEIGDTICLKTDKTKIKEEGKTSVEELVSLLINRFLIFHIDGWEPAVKTFNNSSSPKFTIFAVSKCGFLLEK